MNEEEQRRARNLDKLHRELRKDFDPSQYLTTLNVNAELYRFVHPGNDPTLPTGKEARTVFENKQSPYDIKQYQEDYARGFNFTATHTGSTCYTSCLQGAWNETEGDYPRNKDWYKIIVTKEFKIMDMDTMCKSLGFDRPYIVEEHPVFDEFYGYHQKGLRHQSHKYPEGDTIVIFNDWFRDFDTYIQKVPLDKEKTIFSIKIK